MRKILTLVAIAAVATCLSACSNSKEELYILNWGEYMDTELITNFEKEYNVTIHYQTQESNELMYSQIVAGTTAPYDLVFPSDYMIEKMKNEDLLYEIDFSLLTNYEDGMYADGLDELISETDYSNYFIPYFWGSLGIMYNSEVEGLEEVILENGWASLFEHDLLPSGTKVGMYDVSRDAFAAAQMYLGYSINTTDDTELQACRDLLKNTTFKMWGTDDLKVDISSKNLDLSLVYSGDFFDQLYTSLDNDKEITYGIYAPTDVNNVFFDGIAIPKTSQNVELAHKFIDYLLDFDNSLANAYYVGYCPTIQAVYEEILADEEMDEITQYDAYHPSIILNTEGTKAEIYQDLGTDVYKKLEEYFIEVKA